MRRQNRRRGDGKHARANEHEPARQILRYSHPRTHIER
jgi:hypothetical protein